MIIKKATFKTSVANAKNLPGDKPEIVFAGKSNVGKRSLINLLAGRKRLAISSNTPGRTRLVNFFEINEAFYFVDLPGYGYSKSGKEAEKQYSRLIETFLNTSKIKQNKRKIRCYRRKYRCFIRRVLPSVALCRLYKEIIQTAQEFCMTYKKKQNKTCKPIGK